MRILLFIILFLVLGALFIISNENLHLREKQDMKEFSGLYYSWMSQLFSNFKGISGYFVKFEWLPDLNQSYTKG